MTQSKVNLLRGDRYGVLVAMSQIAGALVDRTLGRPAVDEIRLEDARFTEWDDLTTYSSAQDVIEAWQVKRQASPLPTSSFDKLIRALDEQPGIAVAHMAFLDLVEVKGVGPLRQLAALCDRLESPNLDYDTFLATASEVERKWIDAVSTACGKASEGALGLIARLRVEHFGHERDLEKQILRLLRTISPRPRDLLLALRDHCERFLDSANRIGSAELVEVAQPYCQLVLPHHAQARDAKRPFMVVRLVIDEIQESGAKYHLQLSNRGPMSAKGLVHSLTGGGTILFEGSTPIERTIFPGGGATIYSPDVLLPLGGDSISLQVLLAYDDGEGSGSRRRFRDFHRFLIPRGRVRLGEPIDPESSRPLEVAPGEDSVERAAASGLLEGFSAAEGNVFFVLSDNEPMQFGHNGPVPRGFHWEPARNRLVFVNGEHKVFVPVLPSEHGKHSVYCYWCPTGSVVRVDGGPPQAIGVV